MCRDLANHLQVILVRISPGIRICRASGMLDGLDRLGVDDRENRRDQRITLVSPATLGMGINSTSDDRK